MGGQAISKSSPNLPLPLPLSKTARKRRMLALQRLGEELATLPDADLAGFPISEPLREALLALRTMRKREARRRHKQFIGKLMRTENEQAIRAAWERRMLLARAETRGPTPPQIPERT